MHCMVFDMFRAHWLKCSRANMKGDIGAFNAFLLYCIQDVIIEMQTGSGRSHCTGLPGIHCLVAIEVLRFIAAFYVGR